MKNYFAIITSLISFAVVISSCAIISTELAKESYRNAQNTNDVNQKFAFCCDAITLDSLFTPAYNMRGYLYLQDGQLKKAIQDFTSSINIDHNNYYPYCSRGFAFLRTNKYVSAEGDFNIAIKLNPAFCNSYAGRGLVKLNKKEYLFAVSDYDKAVELGCEGADLFDQRGYCYQQMGNLNEALNDYRRALEIDPNNKYAKENLAQLKEDMGGELPEMPKVDKSKIIEKEISKQIVGIWRRVITLGSITPNQSNILVRYMQFFPKQHGQNYGKALRVTTTSVFYDLGSISSYLHGEDAEQYQYYFSGKTLTLVNKYTGERINYRILYISEDYLNLDGDSWDKQR